MWRFLRCLVAVQDLIAVAGSHCCPWCRWQYLVLAAAAYNRATNSILLVPYRMWQRLDEKVLGPRPYGPWLWHKILPWIPFAASCLSWGRLSPPCTPFEFSYTVKWSHAWCRIRNLSAVRWQPVIDYSIQSKLIWKYSAWFRSKFVSEIFTLENRLKSAIAFFAI